MSAADEKEGPRRIEDHELWDEFWHAGACGGSICGTCDHGITFFHDEELGAFEEGELEKLRAKAVADPENYIGLGGDTHMTEMLGKVWHWDCQKCRAEALRYMEFIWGNRGSISRFLNARLKTVADNAARNLKEQTIQ